jgi:hypothetical protein
MKKRKPDQKNHLKDLNFNKKMNHIYQNPEFGQDWFSYSNLYKIMVKKFPSGSKFVEVGCWKGKSSSFMAVEIFNSGKNIDFYCVDHFLGCAEHYDESDEYYDPDIYKAYEIFTDNMKSLKDYYTLMKMSSLEAANNFKDRSLDFVFLDASHLYENVKNDIDAWKPKIKIGGIFAGHDYFSLGMESGSPFGVKRAVDEKLNPIIVSKFENCWIHKVLD